MPFLSLEPSHLFPLCVDLITVAYRCMRLFLLRSTLCPQYCRRIINAQVATHIKLREKLSVVYALIMRKIFEVTWKSTILAKPRNH